MQGLGLGSQILNAGGGSGSGKIKEVATIADRDALTKSEGKVVRVITPQPDDATVFTGWAEYTVRNGEWEKTAEQEGFDEVFQSTVDDALQTTQKFGDIPAGTPASTLKGQKINTILNNMFFETIPYVYLAPFANLTNVTATVEVGETFNTSVTASLTQRDGGAANRVRIQINEADVQDTALPDALNYSYADNAVVLGDGANRRYRAIIHHDEGPVRQNNKGVNQPGNIAAGSVTSATYTKTARRKIWYAKSVAAPANSAAVRALANVQWDNDFTITINLIDGDSSIVVAVPDNLTLDNVTFNGVLPLNQTAEMLATETIVSVEGGGAGYAKNYRVYRLAPESPYTASSYSITLKAV